MFDKRNNERLFSANPTIKALLLDVPSPAGARKVLMSYCNESWKILNQNSERIQSLEWELQMRSLRVLKTMLSTRSERLANFSVAKLLWRLARENWEDLPADLNDGFFEEMIHLFKSIKGESGIYNNAKAPDYLSIHGRKAAQIRSDQLDELAARTRKWIQRYPSGLDKDVIARRRENKARILKVLHGNEADWNDYLWQIRNVIRTAEQLEALIDLTDEEKSAIHKAHNGKIPFGITPYYVSLMDKEPHRTLDHAVRAQVIPPLNYVETMLQNRGDRCQQFDFMLEHDTSPIDLITRRYPEICILKPYNTCSQICVYCQRNWEIDDVLAENALATRDKIKAAIDWIAEHEAITEVLVTGGDPLIMNDNRLEFVLSEIARIEHVERIRIGSRTPVVLPQRITDSLINIIKPFHEPGRREVVVVTHFEHPYEITPQAMAAVQKFRKQGISVFNQAVFTMENSRRFELVALRKMLRLVGVDPYYTFNTKGKKETQNYRVPLARLMQEIKEEARVLPGSVRTDEPVYNVPRLGKNYIRAGQHHSLLSVLPDGQRVYEFHPWEKNLSLADTYVDTDVPIYEYLQALAERGESADDYQSIWYYY